MVLLSTGVAQAGAAPNVVGQKYSDATSAISGAGMHPVVSTVVGDQKAWPDCLVANQVSRSVAPPENSWRVGDQRSARLAQLRCGCGIGEVAGILGGQPRGEGDRGGRQGGELVGLIRSARPDSADGGTRRRVPCSSSRSSGSSVRHTSVIHGQRVWKWQPGGGSMGLGGSPSRMRRSRLALSFGSGIGTADSSAVEYGCNGCSVKICSTGTFDDLAQVHHRDPIRDVPDHAEVVRDEQVGQPELVLKVLEQVDDLRLYGDVECGDRLVGDDELGPQRKCPRDADALALAAGELVREAVGVFGRKPDPVEQIPHRACSCRGHWTCRAAPSARR